MNRFNISGNGPNDRDWDDQEHFARTQPKIGFNWLAVAGWIFAFIVGGAFWWFLIWAGTRNWRP